MARNKRWINTCDKCGRVYHISGRCLCELEQYWRDMAEYHQREAQKCLETAERVAAEMAGAKAA